MDITAHRILKKARTDLVEGLLTLRSQDARGVDAAQVAALQALTAGLWRLMNDDPSPPECQTCATPIAQGPTGRPRRYCSDACRQQDARR